ncbi:MAG: hypothetical protein PHQ35_11100 [Phycisphaerae bacterium]|nr:hypothetical protein [Phycisphaerae bacterium]
MLYRKLEPNVDTIQEGDFYVEYRRLKPFSRIASMIGEKVPESESEYFRPVPEPRPRETEKEKWIREYCIRVANADSYPPYDGDIRGALSDAWDAATEAAREGK